MIKANITDSDAFLSLESERISQWMGAHGWQKESLKLDGDAIQWRQQINPNRGGEFRECGGGIGWHGVLWALQPASSHFGDYVDCLSYRRCCPSRKKLASWTFMYKWEVFSKTKELQNAGNAIRTRDQEF